VRVLEGLLGDSDREGYKRLYFTRELDSYAEFRAEDVVFREPIPSEQPPMVGLDATRAGIRRDATIEFTRVRTPRPVDEFDLDVRLGVPGRQRRIIGPVPLTDWNQDTCMTCNTQFGCAATCFDPTCATCDTQCGTCETCRTQCGQPTCATCNTRCGQDTCNTCETQCDQWTCPPCFLEGRRA
jgi:hypothetical protein